MCDICMALRFGSGDDLKQLGAHLIFTYVLLTFLHDLLRCAKHLLEEHRLKASVCDTEQKYFNVSSSC